MKKEILTILGKNHTTPAVFDKETSEASALYTYKGDVFCLKDGWDFPFDDITETGKSNILSILKAKTFRFDNTFQG